LIDIEAWVSLLRSSLCGYDIDLKYPETQKLPTITAPLGGLWASLGGSKSQLGHSSFLSTFKSRLRTNLARASFDKRKRELAQREWKRDLSSRANGTIDPWYGCDLLDFVIDYAVNYTYPWSNDTSLGFDVSDDW
jgi:carboxypeptidase D